MEKLKNRKTPLSSKNKLVVAVNLYEKYVDEVIQSIKIISSTIYYFKTYSWEYAVDISNNSVKKVLPDLDFD